MVRQLDEVEGIFKVWRGLRLLGVLQWVVKKISTWYCEFWMPTRIKCTYFGVLQWLSPGSTLRRLGAFLPLQSACKLFVWKVQQSNVLSVVSFSSVHSQCVCLLKFNASTSWKNWLQVNKKRRRHKLASASVSRLAVSQALQLLLCFAGLALAV